MRRFNILQMYSIRWKRAFSRETGRMKLKGANIRSFCTSVVAGIILPAKVVSKDIRLVASGDALIDGINQNTFNGFIAVNSTYSWIGFELYFVSNQQITKLASAPSNIYVSIVLKNGQYYLRNGDSVSPIARVNLINIGDSIA